MVKMFNTYGDMENMEAPDRVVDDVREIGKALGIFTKFLVKIRQKDPC